MDSGEPATSRPAQPDRGPGRWLRVCAGIREDVMDWVPSERAKYAGLGVIVLNTGLLAAFAMYSALGKIVTAPLIVLLPVALIWGWVIFSVDRWLITSTHGMRGVNRTLVFIPRIVLAILLGFTIAEPLALRIFQNSLDTQVSTARTEALVAYQSQLETCNPVSGQWIASLGCGRYHLNVINSPYGPLSQLAAAKQAVAPLQATVHTDTANYQHAVSIAQGECAGTAGAGLSDHAGNGPLCNKDWATASAYKETLDTDTATLSATQNSVARLVVQAAGAQQTYATQLNRTITYAVALKKYDLGRIGIIDEWTALDQLSGQSAFVFYGHWLLVLVLIMLDCLPVLAKLMSGTSAYDQMLAEQVDSDKGVHTVYVRLREDTATVDKEAEIYLIEMRRRERMRSEGRAERVRNAQDESDGLDDVRALADKLMKEMKEEETG